MYTSGKCTIAIIFLLMTQFSVTVNRLVNPFNIGVSTWKNLEISSMDNNIDVGDFTHNMRVENPMNILCGTGFSVIWSDRSTTDMKRGCSTSGKRKSPYSRFQYQISILMPYNTKAIRFCRKKYKYVYGKSMHPE